MKCQNQRGSPAESSDTTLTPNTRSVSLPNAEATFTLTNRRDQHFNTNFYNWELQKRVDGEWYGTVSRRFPTGSSPSLAPGESHAWSVSITNDDLGRQVEPETSNESLTLRALGGGTYAFIVVGSYGTQEQSWRENQPIFGYATPFTLKGDELRLVPTNSVRDASREGNAVTVTVGKGDPDRTITVVKRTGAGTSSEHTYITESVYGDPILRNILAHFDSDVEEVTLQASELSDTGLHIGLKFSYEGTTYEVTNKR